MTLAITTGTPGGSTAAVDTVTFTPSANSLLVICVWVDQGVSDVTLVTDNLGTLPLGKSKEWIGSPAISSGTLAIWTAPVTAANAVSHTFSVSTSSGAVLKRIFPFCWTDSGGQIPGFGNVSAGASSPLHVPTSQSFLSTSVGSRAMMMAFTNVAPGAVAGETLTDNSVYGAEDTALYTLTAPSTALLQTMTVTSSAGCYNTIAFEITLTPATGVGVPFQRAIFGSSASVWVEAAFGANLSAPSTSWVWTDITADVMYSPGINGTWGRNDETSQTTPAALTVSVINTSGNYSAYAMGSAFNSKATPIRVRRQLASVITVEFQGRSVGFTPTYDTTGKLPIVQIVAAGRMRQLGQPKAPAYSPLWRSIERLSDTIAHWPMEETAGPVSANTKSTANPLRIRAGTPTWGSATPPSGALAAVGLGTTACLTTTSSFTGATSFQIGIGWQAAASATGAVQELMRFTLSSGYTIFIAVSDQNSGALGTHGVHMQLQSADNFTLVEGLAFSTAVNGMDGGWHYVVASFQPDGIGFDAFMWVDGVFVSGTAFTGTAVTLGDVRKINIGFTDSTYITNVNNSGVNVTSLYLEASATDQRVGNALFGNTGELVHVRLARVAAEENMPMTITGASNIALGPQPIDTPLAIYRDAEKADGGVLFDGFDDGLRYITRSARYNQSAAFTINAGTNSQLAPPFEPVDDDQRTVNQFAASRPSGGTATFSDTTSPLAVGTIGLYPGSDTFNVATDSPLRGIAGWRVNLGTVNGLRYPTLGTNFINANASTNAQQWLNQLSSSMPIGFRVDVTNVATSAPTHPIGTLLMIVEGYSVHSDLHAWAVIAQCVSYLPWRGLTMNSATQGRIEASGASCQSALAAGATGAFSMLTTLPWTTAAGDYPMDVNIGGEQITFSAMGALAAGVQTATISARGVNGQTILHPAGTPVTVWRPGKVML